jgi:dihydrofolate synthase/folylpolyglutamate synthase
MTTYTVNARAIPAEQLAAMWREASATPVEVWPSSTEALVQSLRPARADDLVCVTGSVFLAGEARPVLLSLLGGDFSAGETAWPAVG